ncbi:MAG TPA: methyltransferase domain-containing protein [Bryobacteraceae bacterium]|nr:methyltransferase domain-containing protein [Bryobacteraceae bacterium]
MNSQEQKSRQNRRILLLDLLVVFLCSAIVIRPLFKAKYLQFWDSIESTFIADGRYLGAHWPHPLWQPLWYGGTRFDYVYPPVLRYGTALLTNFFIPVKAYHVYIAVLFCIGIAGICFLVRVMEGTRIQAWYSAVACLLISPSFLFLPQIANDAPQLMPWRLRVLVRYGEGPHITALSLLPFALAFAFLALRRSQSLALILAGVFSALVALTNFYGATALALFYPILVWSVWVTHRGRDILWRAIAIPALAYALSAFWLTPAYLKITLHNMRYVSQPGNQYSYLLTVALALVFGFASWRLASHRTHATYLTFITGSMLFFALIVLGHFSFNFHILGEPVRLIPELDMTILLFAAEIMRRIWIQLPERARAWRAIIIVAALLPLWPIRHFIRRPWELYRAEPNYREHVEYRLSAWMAEHLPGARTFVTGSTRFWWDAWFDNAEISGGSDQGLINPNPNIATFEFRAGPDAANSVRWLKALGADAIIVSDSHSQDAYHDFQYPYKFANVLPVLFDDHQGDVIYGVPRRYPSLARVLDRARLDAFKPIEPATYQNQLRDYSDFVEQGPDVPTSTHWNGTDSISVHAPVAAGQSILLQVTYDPAWRAYAGKTELPIRPDGMDFMIIDAPPGTQDVKLVFTMPLGNRVGYAVSSLALLFCLFLGVAGRPEPDSPYPFYFRALRAMLRWINRHLPPLPIPSDENQFDPDRLRAAETALRSMKMPDADGDRYLAKHIPRLSKTLAITPPPQKTGRALELGCYMQITPLLERVCGYKEVRGAYYGPQGKIDRKTYDFPDGQFSCYVDHFDVERHEFPYPDNYFDLVLATEIIEHMTYDPMWMLLESRRVLADGGYLLISTPNVGSVTSVAKTLDGRDNPQIFFLYERPGPDGRTDIGHVREYTVHEVGEAVKAAGFEVERLFTTFIGEFAEHKQMLRFLALNGYSTENRGEQIWCLARKKASLPVDRYPWFIYTP